MKKIILVLFLFFVSCSGNEIVSNNDLNIDETTSTVFSEKVSTTTTSIYVSQLDSFTNQTYVISKEKSLVSYHAPKQFLNSGLEVVTGSTNEIIGEFTLSLSECDLADSCVFIQNLIVRVDISTLNSKNSIRDSAIKTQWLESKLFPEAVFRIEELVLPNRDFDSKIEDTIVGKFSIREIELDTPFSISAYFINDEIHITAFTEIDTTWFGFDPPTKFNAWEVLNPIDISVEIIAVKK